MAEKQLQARVKLKGDTLENWKKADGFIPKTNEVLLVTDKHAIMLGNDVKTAKEMAENEDYFITQGDGDTVVTSGAGANSAQQVGTGAQAIGDKSAAFGSSIAGCMGYYYEAIDLTNKKIYLCPDRVVEPTLGAGATYDTINPEYAAGDKIAIVNNNKFFPEAYIESIEGSVITYSGEMEFTQINPDATDTDLDQYCVYVVAKPILSIESGARVIKDYAHAEGRENQAQGAGSHAEGRNNLAYGDGAHAEGRRTKAAWASHSEGQDTEAGAFSSHAEGRQTITVYNTAECSHAEGRAVKVSGYAAHGEGIGKLNGTAVDDYSEAAGRGSHVEGVYNKALAEGAHTEGGSNTTSGLYGHTEGHKNTTTGSFGHTEGVSNTNSGYTSHAEGDGNIILTNQAHVEGQGNTLSGDAHYSHAEGKGNTITARQAHAEGYNHTVSGAAGHAEGYNQTVSGVHGHGEGDSNTVSGDNSHAEGQSNTVTGQSAHAEGKSNSTAAAQSHVEGLSNNIYGAGTEYTLNDVKYTAKNGSDNSHIEGEVNKIYGGTDSHAEGKNNIIYGRAGASGYGGSQCHIEGLNNIISGDNTTEAHVEGRGNKATNAQAHAEGQNTIASGAQSHAGGLGTKATAQAQTAIGQYNAEDANALFIVGNGNSDTDRKNAFVVDKKGNIEARGVTAQTIAARSDIRAFEAEFDYLYSFGGNFTQLTQNNKAVATQEFVRTSYVIAGRKDSTIQGGRTTIEGMNNEATGDISHVEGEDNMTDATHVHIEGRDNIVNSGENSSRYTHIEGRWNTVTGGLASHVEGKNNTIEGSTNPVTGEDDEGTWGGSQCHIEGLGNTISGNYTTEAHVEGRYNKVYAAQGHAEGLYTEVSADAIAAHAEGHKTIASGKYSHAEGGLGTESDGSWDDYMGSPLADQPTIASGSFSHAEGRGTEARGRAAHSEGTYTTAAGENAHAEGRGTYAGKIAHAEGSWTHAADYTHAEGYDTRALGHWSHAEGSTTQANGDAAHAEGYFTRANGDYSHASGVGTVAEMEGQMAIGQYNTNQSYYKEICYAHSYEGYDISIGNNSFSVTYSCPGMSAQALGKKMDSIRGIIYATVTYRYIGDVYDSDGGIWVEGELSTSGQGKITTWDYSYNAENDDSTITYSGILDHSLSTPNYIRPLDQPYCMIEGHYYEGALFTVGNGTYENPSNAFAVDSNGDVHVAGALYIGGIKVEPLGTTIF